MRNRKQILLVIVLVCILALAIEITRWEFVIRLNKNENVTLIDLNHLPGAQIDKQFLESIPQQRFLVIYDPDQRFASTRVNVENVLKYGKYGYDLVEARKVSGLSGDYRSVIIILENIDQLPNPEDLFNYVFRGGNVFFAYRLYVTPGFQNIYRKLGIAEFGAIIQTGGIRLLDNVLIKGRGLEVPAKDLLQNSALSIGLEAGGENYAESLDGTKLLWRKKYGQGNIVYFNGTMLESKINRGLIMGALTLLEEDFIYPIINSKITFIDDFPAPIPEGTHEKISREFNRTIPRFYKDIWWPDMLELAAKYSLKYTGVVIGTYNNETEKVIPGSTDLEIKDYIYFGRDLISHGGEIGIHGYNHQPLYTGELADQSLGYKPWSDLNTMKAAINEIMELSTKAFPNYSFNVYVPPSNIISNEGREALKASAPGIKIIASLYTKAEGEDAYEQEFAAAADGIIEFPRLTYGYTYTDLNLWMMINGITSHGYYSHFVHPDDVLDSDRTGSIGWSELYKDFTRFNKMVFDNFSWLRSSTASEGANEAIKYLQVQPVYDKSDTYLKTYCGNYYENVYFILRSNKKVESVENCSIKEIDDHVYLVKSNAPHWQIIYKR